MKELHIICCTTSEKRFGWELFIYLNNLRELGVSDRARILIFSYKGYSPDPYFATLEEEFKEVSFFHYEDEDRVVEDIRDTKYPALSRPYMLAKHFHTYPHLSKGAIFYTDSDILLSNISFLTPYLHDEVNYLSHAGGREKGENYLGPEYIDSKVKDVLNEKYIEYMDVDVLEEMAGFFGLDRQFCENRADQFGGAQYLLKDIDHTFWVAVYNASMYIRNYLKKHINKQFFETEEKGFQSYCADMWAILFVLWQSGREIRCPEAMDFSWATDRVEKVNQMNIYHNAGITRDGVLRDNQRGPDGKKEEVTCPAFNKSNYQLTTPFEDIEHIRQVAEHPVSKRFGTSVYAQEILKIHSKYKLCSQTEDSLKATSE